MNEFETIIHIMKQDNLTYDDLSERTGKNTSNIYKTLNKQKNMTVKTFRELANDLGYDLQLVSRENKTSYTIDDSGNPSPLRFTDMSLNFDQILSK